MANFTGNKTVVFLLPALLCLVVIVLYVPSTALAQEDDLLRTAAIEKRLKQRFKLTPRDAKLLHPLIKLENEKVVLTYERYSNDESTNYLNLWESIRDGRREFEANFEKGLTLRQKRALNFARTEFESRILRLWMEDYIDLLGDILTLDRLQMSSVLNIFDREREKRHRLILIAARKHIRMNAEWQKLTDEREKSLKLVLDPEQIREYRSLVEPAEDMVATVD